MIASADAAPYGVLLLDLSNDCESRNSQILAIKTSPTVYTCCIYMYMYVDATSPVSPVCVVSIATLHVCFI